MRIALIAKFGWVGISTSFINTALFWEKKGRAVDLYVEQPDETRFPLPDFHGQNIRVIRTSIRAGKPMDDYLFCRNAFDRSAKYDWLIAFDIEGLVRAGTCQLMRGGNVIYHSLEFYEPAHRSIRTSAAKRLERFFARRAAYVFTQDAARAAFLQRDLRVDESRFRLIYNSPRGDAIRESADIFRVRFGIERDSRIVLCVGSLMRETRVIDIVMSVRNWDQQFVLVLHGWFPDKAVLDVVLKQQEALPGRIFVSVELFDHWSKYLPFLSCDIGLVGFTADTNNLKYAAGSAGKIIDFFRTGKPVAAFDGPGMTSLIEGNNAGIVFDEASQMPSALARIEDRYDYFCRNSLAAYPEYEFDRQYEKVYAELASPGPARPGHAGNRR